MYPMLALIKWIGLSGDYEFMVAGFSSKSRRMYVLTVTRASKFREFKSPFRRPP